MATSVPQHPISSPVAVPLKGGDDDEIMRSNAGLRPTLSFREKPQPPRIPSQVNGEGEKTLRPTLSFRQKPEPPPSPFEQNGLRPTLSFRQKPEAPRTISFHEPPPSPQPMQDLEKQREMQKTKSKMDVLSSLIRAQSSTLASSSSDDDYSSDEDEDASTATAAKGGGRFLLRPGQPPPAPPGLSAQSDLPPLPKFMVPETVDGSKPVATNMSSNYPPPVITSDDNASENWTQMWSPEQNRNYYYNKNTGASTWENPTVLSAQPKVVSPTSTHPSRLTPKNDLERLAHKMNMQHQMGVQAPNSTNDDEVDVFGRSNASRAAGSGNSNGSNSSGRLSIRATLSRAFGLGSMSKKASSSPLRNSDSSTTSPPARGLIKPVVPPPVEEPTVFTAAAEHERPAVATKGKHVEIVAEVKTKSGRHTIVRSKKSKKKQQVPSQPTSPIGVQPPQQFSSFMSPAQPAAYMLSPSPLNSSNSNVMPQHFAPNPMQQHFHPIQPIGFSPTPPPQLLHVQALYDFAPHNPTSDSELVLRRGDVLQLIDQGNDGWWEGIHLATGRRGLFPGSYVQFLN